MNNAHWVLLAAEVPTAKTMKHLHLIGRNLCPSVSLVMKKRSMNGWEWLITNGNDEQQSDGSLWGVFVCKRVHQIVHHLGQFSARAPNIQHFDMRLCRLSSNAATLQNWRRLTPYLSSMWQKCYKIFCVQSMLWYEYHMYMIIFYVTNYIFHVINIRVPI